LALYCLTRAAQATTPEWVRAACEAQEVAFVAVDPLGDPPDGTGSESAVLRLDDSDEARTLERAMVRAGAMHVYVNDQRALVDVDVHATLEAAGQPVVRVQRVGRASDRDRLRTQVEVLGGLPVTLIVGQRDGTTLPMESLPSLFSVVDYLQHQKEPLWLRRGDAWHVERDVYLLDRHLLGGIDRWPWLRSAYLSPLSFDDVLAVRAVGVLGFRFAVVTLSWGPEGQPHVAAARVPVSFPPGLGEAVAGKVVEWLCARDLQ